MDISCESCGQEWSTDELVEAKRFGDSEFSFIGSRLKSCPGCEESDEYTQVVQAEAPVS